MHLGKIEDALHVQGVVDMNMDPKNRVFLEGIESVIELKIVLFGAGRGIFEPEGLVLIHLGFV